MPHKETTMNVALLEKIAEVIVEQPDNFDMGDWHCDSSHCIGGWAQLLSGLPQTKDASNMADLLGLEFEPERLEDEGPDLHAHDNCESGRLFYEGNWPSKFRYYGSEEYDSADVARVAAARIRHFIATEGRE